MLHSNYTYTNGVHYPYSYVYTSSAARLAATGFLASDVGKFAWQQNGAGGDGVQTVWMLTEVTPTWQQIGNGSSVVSNSVSLANGKIWVGDSIGIAQEKTISGNGTITNAGVLAVSNLTIASEARGDIIRRGATVWERVSAKTSGNILIGNGTDIASVAVSGDASMTSAGAVTVKRPLGFLIEGALTTSSKLNDITIPVGMTLGNIIFDVGTAVATGDMTIEVTYGTNPASKATLFGTTKPKITNGSYTSTDGVLTVTSLAARGHLTVTLTGTFTAATDLTIWLIPS